MDSIENNTVSQDERLWGAGVHIGALIAAFFTSWMVGIAGAVVSLCIWFVVRDRNPFAAAHAKECFNFNLSMFLYACVAVVLGLILGVGAIIATIATLGVAALVAAPMVLVIVLALGAIAILWVVFGIIAAMKAYEGQLYRYPMTLRFLK